MFLKNYTSTVPSAQTIHKIEQVLIKCGVSGITKEYAGPDGKIAALTFRIQIPDMAPVTIRLPADVKAAQQALWLEYADGDKLTADGSALAYNVRKKLKRKDFLEQGERTAWKLMQDWVEVQMSLIQVKQAEFLQVFLPYVWDGRQSFYGTLKQHGFKAMLPEKCDHGEDNS